MATIKELTPQIVLAWREYPDGSMLRRDVLPFHGWLRSNHPELLRFKCAGDPRQKLKEILLDHCLD